MFAVARAFNITILFSTIACLGTGIFAIFAIQDTITDISKSVIFLFFVRPFEIGDVITVDGKGYCVMKIGFLTTTLKGDQDAIVYAKNSSLNGAIIANSRRSDDKYEAVSLLLHPSTRFNLIDSSESKLNASCS